MAKSQKLDYSVRQAIVKLHKEKHTIRPRKTSAREDRIMLRMSLKDRFKSCTEIIRVMNSTSCVNVSRQIVSRRLQEIGLEQEGEKSKNKVIQN